MTRPVPYPADVRAKGWRFEIDYEKVEQSDTWDLASEVPMAQPALLMMWMMAWTQVPCGSMPADENLIRVKCRIPPKLWPSLRPILMRGWWLAEDGRLYHDTIVLRVQEMLDYRRKNAVRVANHKAKGKKSLGGNALAEGDQQGSNDTGTGTGTSSSSFHSEEGARATPGEACKAMRAAGMADVSPSHPKLIALLDAGITVPELVDAAAHALKSKKPFTYALATAEGRRRDAATAALPPPASVTVPGNPGRDPALQKLDEDARITKPPSLETLEQLARLRAGVPA